MQLAILKGSQGEDNVIISCVPYAIGRCRSADFIIAHVNVSRNHCKIVKEDGLWKIHDLSSSGTYVNDNLVGQGKSTTLNNGDRIRFGHSESNLCRTFHSFDGSSENSIDSVITPKSPGYPDNLGKRCSGEVDNRTVTFKQNHVLEGSQEALKHKFGRTKEKLQQIKETNISQILNEQTSSEDYSNSGREKNDKERNESEKLEELAKELQQVRKALSNLEEKNSACQRELTVETNNKSLPSTDKNLLENLADLMETELQCTICSELFVTAVTLSCTHTFCKYCIDQWKRKQKTCPVCRKKITNETQSLVIDNYIDKMVGNLSVELKERREAIIKERNEVGPFRKRSKLKRVKRKSCDSKKKPEEENFTCKKASNYVFVEQNTLYQKGSQPFLLLLKLWLLLS